MFLRKTKKLCNDLGLCGVKGNTLSRTSPKTEKIKKIKVKKKCLGELQVISSQTGTVPMVTKVRLTWGGGVSLILDKE